MSLRKIVSATLCGCMIFTMSTYGAFAQGTITDNQSFKFLDMPENWSKEALSKAVSNGLIKGYQKEEGSFIRPQGNLTRAEMATIISASFGTKEKASLKGVADIKSSDWFAEPIAKAVQMDVLEKDNYMRPNAKATRQEVFTVMARTLNLDDMSIDVLDKFIDEKDIATWAKGPIAALVKAGYVSGSDGKLNPMQNITRAEFSVIMDNAIKRYFNVAGTYTEDTIAGNIMINTENVVIKDMTIKGDLILGHGIGEGDATLDNVNVSGRLIVRGGGENSINIKGNSKINMLLVAKQEGAVRVNLTEGRVETALITGDAPILVISPKSQIGLVVANASVSIDNKGIIEKVEINKEGVSVSGNAPKETKTAEGVKAPISQEKPQAPSSSGGGGGGGDGGAVSVNKSALNAAINSAQVKHDAATEGANLGDYKGGSKADFLSAISKAKVVAEKASPSQSEVNQALAELNEALKNFDEAQNSSVEADTLIALKDALANQKVREITIATSDGITIPSGDMVEIPSDKTVKVQSALKVEGTLKVGDALKAAPKITTMGAKIRTMGAKAEPRLVIQAGGKLTAEDNSSLEFDSFDEIITAEQNNVLLYGGADVKVGNTQYIGDSANDGLIKLSNRNGSAEPAAGFFLNGDGDLLLIIFGNAEIIKTNTALSSVGILVKGTESVTRIGELTIPSMDTILSTKGITIEANGGLTVTGKGKIVSSGGGIESIFLATCDPDDGDNRHGASFSRGNDNGIIVRINGEVTMKKALSEALIVPCYWLKDGYHNSDLRPVLDIAFEPKNGDFKIDGYVWNATPEQEKYEYIEQDNKLEGPWTIVAD